MKDTSKLIRAEHFEKLRAQGDKVLTFKSACCGEVIDVAAAMERSTAHTMIDCVACGSVLTVAVTDSLVTTHVADVDDRAED